MGNAWISPGQWGSSEDISSTITRGIHPKIVMRRVNDQPCCGIWYKMVVLCVETHPFWCSFAAEMEEKAKPNMRFLMEGYDDFCIEGSCFRKSAAGFNMKDWDFTGVEIPLVRNLRSAPSEWMSAMRCSQKPGDFP